MIHLVKLCVGAEGVDDLIDWQRLHFGDGPARHLTRMWPKREEEILDGGSLYWVFKGLVLARQRIVSLDESIGDDGIRRCAIGLDREVVLTEAQPRRPFQGWRYLDPDAAPADLRRGEAASARTKAPPLPRALPAALAAIGLR